MRNNESFLYNLENLNGVEIEHHVTAEFLREEYGIKTQAGQQEDVTEYKASLS